MNKEEIRCEYKKMTRSELKKDKELLENGLNMVEIIPSYLVFRNRKIISLSEVTYRLAMIGLNYDSKIQGA